MSSNVKRANTPVEYTPDSLLELKKCSEDPIYFIQNYIKITHPVRGLIPFDLYDYQKEIIQAFEDNRFTCVRAARQLGKCVSFNTVTNIFVKPKGLKRLILKLLFRQEYDEIFGK